MASTPRRRRRTGQEIRALLLDAARASFAEHGYAAATTRRIAERAGVSETLLFRHFSSKELLFETAVLQPLDEFLEVFTSGWAGAASDIAPERLLAQFVTGVYDRCQEHRELLLALPMGEVARPIPQATFARLEQMADVVARRFGFGYDAAVAVRAAVLAVAMTALFEAELFPEPVGRDRITRELTGLLVGGLVRR